MKIHALWQSRNFRYFKHLLIWRSCHSIILTQHSFFWRLKLLFSISWHILFFLKTRRHCQVRFQHCFLKHVFSAPFCIFFIGFSVSLVKTIKKYYEDKSSKTKSSKFSQCSVSFINSLRCKIWYFSIVRHNLHCRNNSKSIVKGEGRISSVQSIIYAKFVKAGFYITKIHSSNANYSLS